MEKLTKGWHDAIAWVDAHPKTTLIGICALAALGVIGWLV